MKNIAYYISIFADEFKDRMAYHSLKTGRTGSITEEELKLVRDLNKCSPVSSYLSEPFVDQMKEFLQNGFENRDVGEFARAAKLSAKVGNKWCIDILLLSIKWSRENGAGLIREATIQALL